MTVWYLVAPEVLFRYNNYDSFPTFIVWRVGSICCNGQTAWIGCLSVKYSVVYRCDKLPHRGLRRGVTLRYCWATEYAIEGT